MISETGQLKILQGELGEAIATIDYLRSELWFQAQYLDQAYDRLYDAIVLLASCDSCSDESLRWMQDRFVESDVTGATADVLSIRDKRNAHMLLDVGIDLECWTQPEGQTEDQENRDV